VLPPGGAMAKIVSVSTQRPDGLLPDLGQAIIVGARRNVL